MAIWLSLQTHPALGRETDNFCLPLDTELADLGDYLEAVHTCVLEDIVRDLNARIERALRIANGTTRARQLDQLHDPTALAEAFVARFGHPFVEDALLEQALRGRWAKASYPGQKTSSADAWMNFSAHRLLDPRKYISTARPSHTIRAYGIYFGTDKVVHFHHSGISYYSMYRTLLKRGLSSEDALRTVIEEHARRGLWSETGLFGTVLTGIYSNADMAANWAGFKFYLNLTEPVVLKGQPRDPLVIRNGTFWRLNQHVRLRSGWFSAYISDHWNEALNPNLYEASMQPGIRRVLTLRAAHIVQFYTRKDKRPNDPVYFDALARELATYYGEPYGHSGRFEELMTIGNTCMPALHTHLGQ